MIVSTEDAANCPVPCLIAGDSYVAFARIAALFDIPASHAPGIHPSAVVDASARVAPSARHAGHDHMIDGVTTPKPTIFHNPQCSKSRSAKEILEGSGAEAVCCILRLSQSKSGAEPMNLPFILRKSMKPLLLVFVLVNVVISACILRSARKNAVPPGAHMLPVSSQSGGELRIRGTDGKALGACPLQHTDVDADIVGYITRVHVR